MPILVGLPDIKHYFGYLDDKNQVSENFDSDHKIKWTRLTSMNSTLSWQTLAKMAQEEPRMSLFLLFLTKRNLVFDKIFVLKIGPFKTPISESKNVQ